MENWNVYQQTVFVLDDKKSGYCFPETFGIVTAWNPDGVSQSAGVNAQSDMDLKRALFSEGFTPIRITGCSPDFKHAEPGWLIEAGKEEVAQWGRRYNQDAVFWIEMDTIYLVPCEEGSAETTSVGVFSSRLISGRQE